jgi:hypothetical protein
LGFFVTLPHRTKWWAGGAAAFGGILSSTSRRLLSTAVVRSSILFFSNRALHFQPLLTVVLYLLCYRLLSLLFRSSSLLLWADGSKRTAEECNQMLRRA